MFNLDANVVRGYFNSDTSDTKRALAHFYAAVYSDFAGMREHQVTLTLLEDRDNSGVGDFTLKSVNEAAQHMRDAGFNVEVEADKEQDGDAPDIEDNPDLEEPNWDDGDSLADAVNELLPIIEVTITW
ncbi:hypothetical protein [Burkholderia phage BCSR5]|nr:hypothetical protein [Burkholderia phage BCSR5]